MTEVPPPTRRARKDAPATVGTPAVGGAQQGTPDPSAAAGATPAIPGSATAAAAAFATTPRDAGPPMTDASAPSVDVDHDPERMATAQLEMAAFGDHLIPYVPPQPPAPRSMAPWALALAILALTASLFTGWLLLLGVGGVVVASLSLRRPHDSRRAARWALSLALLSLVFSVGWLVWGFSQLAVI